MLAQVCGVGYSLASCAGQSNLDEIAKIAILFLYQKVEAESKQLLLLLE